MFNNEDIKRVQFQRPDLSEDKAGDVLGFLMDTYADEPYAINSDKLFKDTANYMFPEVKNG